MTQDTRSFEFASQSLPVESRERFRPLWDELVNDAEYQRVVSAWLWSSITGFNFSADRELSKQPKQMFDAALEKYNLSDIEMTEWQFLSFVHQLIAVADYLYTLRMMSDEL